MRKLEIEIETGTEERVIVTVGGERVVSEVVNNVLKNGLRLPRVSQVVDPVLQLRYVAVDGLGKREMPDLLVVDNLGDMYGMG